MDRTEAPWWWRLTRGTGRWLLPLAATVLYLAWALSWFRSSGPLLA